MKELDDIVKKMNKAFGEGSAVNLGGGAAQHTQRKLLPSGLATFDKYSGGGIATGITEVFGWEGSGKTTFALHMIAQAQKAGHACLYVDTEHSLNPEYAKKLGVDLERLVLTQPDCGEDAVEIARMGIESEQFNVVVFDSIATMKPRQEAQGEISDANMGLHARLMGKMWRVLIPLINKHDVFVIAINQFREKIGVMYGDNRTTPGGNATKFACEMRIEVAAKRNDDGTAETKFHIRKNKHAAPYVKFSELLIYGEGFDQDLSRFNSLVESGEIERSGAYYSLNGERIGKGKKEAMQTLKRMAEDGQTEDSESN